MVFLKDLVVRVIKNLEKCGVSGYIHTLILVTLIIVCTSITFPFPPSSPPPDLYFGHHHFLFCFFYLCHLWFYAVSGYRDDSLETVKKNQEDYEMPLKILSYEELYGWTMDQIVAQVSAGIGPCTEYLEILRSILDIIWYDFPCHYPDEHGWAINIKLPICWLWEKQGWKVNFLALLHALPNGDVDCCCVCGHCTANCYHLEESNYFSFVFFCQLARKQKLSSITYQMFQYLH